ncbi:T9SS type A sorting domain-containing protein [Taibaiella lutea]|uniref:T9SS type A sorting domain-containing protein n=1 Tax=Taibaiella lutea TaxID=2608001 RepID=A0A5M6CHF7_9BACT|nr:DNA/RNA non-specific endonuclease [Taibaiella lutea]KAA5534594.1 T9SS type A sorting domain-containing protein [Taibaiella lutea]
MKKLLFTFLIALIAMFSQAQSVYVNGFGASTASPADPPSTLDANLSTGSWTIASGSFSSLAGATGEALSMSSATATTNTWMLPLTVTAAHSLALTSFSFWNRASATGYTNWQLDVNGTVIGSGSVSASGASTGTISISGPALTAVSALTGSVNVHLVWSGGTHGSTGTGRLDNFTLNGTTTTSGCSGTPANGTATASITSLCSGNTTTLTLFGASTGAGISYQWQSFVSGAWSNISSANSLTYTTPALSANAYYRCTTTCSNSGLSGNSNIDTITVHPLPAPSISGTASIFSGASTNLTFTGTTGDTITYTDGTTPAVTVISGMSSVVSVSPTVSTTYSITSATSSFGCTQSISGQSATVTIISPTDTIPTRDNNLAMGNPSGATTATTDSNNYLITKYQYTLSYNNHNGMANWVSWHLSRAWTGTSTRCNCFTQDAALPAGYYKASTGNYTNTGFDRGHLCPSADRNGNDTDNAVTYKMTNISPQAPILNEQTWAALEDYCRQLTLEGYETYIIAGAYGTGGSGDTGGTTNNIASGKINVPDHFYKIVVVLPVGSNDLSRVDTNTRVIAVIMPNTQAANAHTWDYYRTTVDSIESITGYDYLSNVAAPIQAVIEASTDNGPVPIAAWNFTAANNVATFAATTYDDKLDTTASQKNLTRGATAAASTGAHSFRTTGFKNNGISTANTDYFQTQIKAQSGYELSLTGLNAAFGGTASFFAGTGVTSQFAYSLDGTNFTLIGSPVTSTSLAIGPINLSGITALQDLPSTATVTLRYYASGQTTTGGWGFTSADSGVNGFIIEGTIIPTGAKGAAQGATSITVTNYNNIHATIYPNPAYDKLYIDFTADKAGKVNVRIVDLSGKKVYAKEIGTYQNGNINIPLNNLAPGVYITELSIGDQKIVQRFVKK